jgi:hypothetical protein
MTNSPWGHSSSPKKAKKKKKKKAKKKARKRLKKPQCQHPSCWSWYSGEETVLTQDSGGCFHGLEDEKKKRAKKKAVRKKAKKKVAKKRPKKAKRAPTRKAAPRISSVPTGDPDQESSISACFMSAEDKVKGALTANKVANAMADAPYCSKIVKRHGKRKIAQAWAASSKKIKERYGYGPGRENSYPRASWASGWLLGYWS